MTVPTERGLVRNFSAGLVATLTAAALWRSDDSSLWCTAVVFVAAYLGQDVAHWLTREPTMQSSYLGAEANSPWHHSLRMLLLHTYYLVPFCVEAASHSRVWRHVAGWMTPRTACARATHEEA